MVDFYFACQITTLGLYNRYFTKDLVSIVEMLIPQENNSKWTIIVVLSDIQILVIEMLVELVWGKISLRVNPGLTIWNKRTLKFWKYKDLVRATECSPDRSLGGPTLPCCVETECLIYPAAHPTDSTRNNNFFPPLLTQQSLFHILHTLLS